MTVISTLAPTVTRAAKGVSKLAGRVSQRADYAIVDFMAMQLPNHAKKVERLERYGIGGKEEIIRSKMKLAASAVSTTAWAFAGKLAGKVGNFAERFIPKAK